MTTLLHPAFAHLIDELLAASDQSQQQLMQRLSALPAADRNALMADANHRALYEYARHTHLAISRNTGKILYSLARLQAARVIVEFGASYGVSTLHLSAALKDNGGGTMLSTEMEPSKAAQARENLKKAGLEHGVDILDGDALASLPARMPASVDLLFLDGAKPLYAQVLALVDPRLRVGALVIADNADGSASYLKAVRDDPRFVSMRIARDVELSIKLAA